MSRPGFYNHKQKYRKKKIDVESPQSFSDYNQLFLSSIGNQNLQHLMESGLIQAKLLFSNPGDLSEKEADMIAEKVTNNNGNKDNSWNKKKKKDSFASSIENKIKGLTGGKPLNQSIRSYFEPRFGVDLSTIRIHDNPYAHQMAESIHARAFTYGNHIVFGEGEYKLGNPKSDKLIAHEIAHTLQQKNYPCKVNRYTLTGNKDDMDGYRFDGHLNIYGKEGDDIDPKKDLILFYKDIDKIVKDYIKLGYQDKDIISLNGYEITIGALKEIINTNKEIVDSATTIFGSYQSEHAKSLLEDGHMSYKEALEAQKDIKSFWRTTIPLKYEHWNIRYVLNQNKQFLTMSQENRKKIFADPDDRLKAENGETVTKYAFNEEWNLLTKSKSIYHGLENFKWTSKTGRELVVRPDGSIEDSAEKMGTYNFGLDNLSHFDLDIRPYWDYKNLPKDKTPVMERVFGPSKDKK